MTLLWQRLYSLHILVHMYVYVSWNGWGKKDRYFENVGDPLKWKFTVRIVTTKHLTHAVRVRARCLEKNKPTGRERDPMKSRVHMDAYAMLDVVTLECSDFLSQHMTFDDTMTQNLLCQNQQLTKLWHDPFCVHPRGQKVHVRVPFWDNILIFPLQSILL